ncbi:MAG TPA: hypothetical protein VHR45_14310 [Thermoanaerobaculia bacterium]|nr:hypothetical protein [Thermoanaerobaculia bacterium]
MPLEPLELLELLEPPELLELEEPLPPLLEELLLELPEAEEPPPPDEPPEDPPPEDPLPEDALDPLSEPPCGPATTRVPKARRKVKNAPKIKSNVVLLMAASVKRARLRSDLPSTCGGA